MDLVPLQIMGGIIYYDRKIVGEVRGKGEFAGQALWLSTQLNWALTTDSLGSLVLIATKKGD